MARKHLHDVARFLCQKRCHYCSWCPCSCRCNEAPNENLEKVYKSHQKTTRSQFRNLKWNSPRTNLSWIQTWVKLVEANKIDRQQLVITLWVWHVVGWLGNKIIYLDIKNILIETINKSESDKKNSRHLWLPWSRRGNYQ